MAGCSQVYQHWKAWIQVWYWQKQARRRCYGDTE